MKRLVLGLALAGACPAVEPLTVRPPLWHDRDDRPIPKPAKRKVSEMYNILYNSWLRHLSPEQKALAARDKGALNVNAWDEAPDSSWFTNRIGRRPLSFDDIQRSLGGVEPESGTWTLERTINEGYTPKFIMKDGAGRAYFLKFDLPSAPERNSAAERISTLILHAAGYNVPGNFIVRFSPARIRLTPESQYQDALERRRPMTAEDLEDMLGKLKPAVEGGYRGVASMTLEGEDIGKFRYDGTRKDDPNDIVPHELRRELRGLRVIASWINHADTGDKNTLNTFIPSAGKLGYVRHHLMDFGSTLGSGDYTNGPYRVGHEYLFDGSAMARTLVTFGAWRRPWESRGTIRFPEIGYFESELFEPKNWKGNYPNLAFVRMDEGDAYWGAKIVTAFGDSLIDRIVETGEYTRPDAARHVAATLKQRRDTIGRFWFDRITPLEDFVVDGGRIRFRDLGAERGYVEPGRKLRCRAEDFRGRRSAHAECERASCPILLEPGGEPEKDRFGRRIWMRVSIQSAKSAAGWASPVEVFIGKSGESDRLSVVGWRHAPR